MADASPTAADVRLVANDPEDTLDFDAASGYTPALGDLVGLSGANEVDDCDATDADGPTRPIGVVADYKVSTLNDGTQGYRVTVAFRALVGGFSGLTAGDVLYNSTTAGAWEDADPTTTGVTGHAVGIAMSATEVYVALPSLS